MANPRGAGSGGKKKHRMKAEREALAELAQPRGDALANARRQLRTAAKAALIALVVVWLLAFGFRSGLDTDIPLIVGASLTLAGAIAALLIRRNLTKSEHMGSLVAGAADLSDEERASRLAKLDKKVAKGDAAAILAKAQLLMQDDPRGALEVLEGVNLDKAQKLIAAQVRGMRGMIHLNLGEVKASRALAETIDLAKVPDPKLRANLSAIVAEAWARTGNPIEGTALLDKYDVDDAEFADVRMQLIRARVFTCAHRQDLKGMRRHLKMLIAISPQLAGMFVGQKRIHPLLEKEARKALEKSGLAPRQKIQMARR